MPLDCITDAEITMAIHYLDPDASVERTEDHCDRDTILGMDLSFVIALAGVLAYLWLYMRTA
jgi:hypothetical protein